MTTTTTNPQHDVPLPPEFELVGQQQASQLVRKMMVSRGSWVIWLL
jgi:hypothetical protein